MNEKTRKLSRRHFLLAAGAGSAATAAAIVAQQAKSPATAKEGDKRATRGYHATDHIHNYYRTTKV